MMGGAKKDSNNPAFNSKYADLASVVAALKEPLASNGLSVVQIPCTNEKDEVGVETILMHSSGEWIHAEPYFMPVAKANAHGFGSILTYTRRYSLASICGIAPEDDDANEGVKDKPKDYAKHAAGQVAKDEFEGMNAEEQKFLQERATIIISKHEAGEDAQAYYVSQNFDTEEKLALWSLLPSAVRTAIKKPKVTALASQP